MESYASSHLACHDTPYVLSSHHPFLWSCEPIHPPVFSSPLVVLVITHSPSYKDHQEQSVQGRRTTVAAPWRQQPEMEEQVHFCYICPPLPGILSPTGSQELSLHPLPSIAPHLSIAQKHSDTAMDPHYHRHHHLPRYCNDRNHLRQHQTLGQQQPRQESLEQHQPCHEPQHQRAGEPQHQRFHEQQQPLPQPLISPSPPLPSSPPPQQRFQQPLHEQHPQQFPELPPLPPPYSCQHSPHPHQPQQPQQAQQRAQLWQAQQPQQARRPHRPQQSQQSPLPEPTPPLTLTLSTIWPAHHTALRSLILTRPTAPSQRRFLLSSLRARHPGEIFVFLNDGSGGFGGAAGAAGDTVGGGGDGSGELGSSRRAIRRACAYFEGYWRYRAGLPALRRVVRDGFGVVGRGMGVWC